MNLREIETLVDLVHVAKVSEVTVRSNERRVTIRKDPGASPHKHSPVEVVATARPSAQSASAAPQLAAAQASEMFVRAPMVGVYHTASPPLEVGAPVQLGQVVGAIESMRLLNDVRAEVSGVVGSVLLEDGMAVEYGQPILRIDTAPEDSEESDGV